MQTRHLPQIILPFAESLSERGALREAIKHNEVLYCSVPTQYNHIMFNSRPYTSRHSAKGVQLFARQGDTKIVHPSTVAHPALLSLQA